jgi:hypothetical protein
MFLCILNGFKLFDRNVISYFVDFFLCIILVPPRQITISVLNEKFRVFGFVHMVR